MFFLYFVYFEISKKILIPIQKTLQSIILYFSGRGLQFKPTKVTVDLRTSQEGIKHGTWTDVEIVGYKFHVVQSW